MAPAPFRNTVAQVILQYISPPSQLDRPLPPCLLSKTLRQRYHFLGVSPENPKEYLCWPVPYSNTSHKVIDLLENLPQTDGDTHFNVRYTADDEYAYAHVHPPASGDDGIRLIFQWDQEEGWRYHDTRLLPFPPNSQLSPVDISSAILKPVDQSTTVHRPNHDAAVSEDASDSDDDDYWNAYGAQEPTIVDEDTVAVVTESANSEDAYWNLYSKVHGSADSTRPSPPPMPFRKPYQLEDVPMDPDSPHPLPVPVRVVSEDTYEDALPIPSGAIIKPSTHFPWDPASPRALSQLLSNISPRGSPHTQSLATSSGFETELESDILSPVPESDCTSSTGLGLIGAHDDVDDSSCVQMDTLDDGRITTESIDDGLRDSIRGIYSLWKASRICAINRPDGETDRDTFLRIVEGLI